jgi:nondiscriminating aspartyl-tRNA synthetase
MERTLIVEALRAKGERVRLKGWVNMRRDHGKILFLDVRDRSGTVQLVVIPDHSAAYEAARECRNECIIEAIGVVKSRPGGAERADTLGSIEVEVEELIILSAPESPLPFEIAEGGLEELHLDTLLNNRIFSLRNRKVQAIFRLYGILVSAYADALRSRGFLEVKTPKVVNAATEGGANFFKIKYFDRDAFLAQSPQFYKEAGASVFERVFEIGPVFRAEPHFTTRHVNEYVSLDAEMAFIEGVGDVMNELESIIFDVFEKIGERGKEELELWGAEAPKRVAIPRMKLTEALQILEKEFGKKMEGGEIDIDPEGERMICEYVKREFGSDFVFLTHYPTAIRPFYTLPGADPHFTESFDLLFRGLELATGGQRIHEYKKMVESIKKRGMNPEDFSNYLDTFRYGCPPHGGWGWGSERTIQQLLGLPTIKQAVLFPRDVKRLTP